MPQPLTLLTSRRSYEFWSDQLRLTMLSTPQVMQIVQQAFHFQSAAVGMPLPTFGPVPSTSPPGVAFDAGAWLTVEGQLVPIRFIHFEPRRIVIDLAGPSPVIDAVYGHLIGILSGIHAPDGLPAVGEPHDILNYSEISAHFAFSLGDLFASPVRELFRQAMAVQDDREHIIVLPTVYLKSQSILEEAGGSSVPDSRTLALSVRVGTLLKDQMYFSTAPLDSAAHITYLRNLESALTTSDT